MPSSRFFLGIKVRIARPTDNLEAVVSFYRDGLGLEVLGSFENHEGFDGVMLGMPGEQVHFEFTRQHGPYWGRQGANFEDPDGYGSCCRTPPGRISRQRILFGRFEAVRQPQTPT